MKASKTSKIILFICILFLSACAQRHPVLYPNPYLKQVGNERAQSDIDECMRLAAEYGTKSDSGEKVACRANQVACSATQAFTRFFFPE